MCASVQCVQCICTDVNAVKDEATLVSGCLGTVVFITVVFFSISSSVMEDENKSDKIYY